MIVQHFLVLSIVATIVTIGGLLLRYRSRLDYSISLNAAKHPVTLVWLGIGSGISLALASIWYIGWFMPTYDAGLIQSLLFGAIIISFVTAVIVPDIQGKRRIIHRLAAYAAVILIPFFLISVFGYLNQIGQAVALACVAAQFGMMYLLFFVRTALRRLLQYQAVYLISFFTILLLLTYA